MFGHHHHWRERFERREGADSRGWGRNGEHHGRDGGGGIGRGGIGRGLGGHGGGGRRGGRMFDQGDLRLVLLALVAEKPSHGYELIKAVEERLGGAYAPSPGTVYPTLTLLEEMGYATVQPEEGGRKLYAATEEGRAWLETNKATVEALFGRMAEVRGRAGVAPPILRAMENLRLALRLKLQAGELSDQQVRAITTALDASAVEVERA